MHSYQSAKLKSLILILPPKLFSGYAPLIYINVANILRPFSKNSKVKTLQHQILSHCKSEATKPKYWQWFSCFFRYSKQWSAYCTHVFLHILYFLCLCFIWMFCFSWCEWIFQKPTPATQQTHQLFKFSAWLRQNMPHNACH